VLPKGQCSPPLTGARCDATTTYSKDAKVVVARQRPLTRRASRALAASNMCECLVSYDSGPDQAAAAPGSASEVGRPGVAFRSATQHGGADHG
jgi:hypothetical protein